MDYSGLSHIFLGFIGCHLVNSLLVTKIEVPEIVDFRNPPTLSCSYNLGEHKLNSVKWYKDGMEFFRYSPMMHSTFMTFDVNGIVTNNEKFNCNETTCSIKLSQLEQNSSGVYRCEVSGDAPEFKLASKIANMTVAVLPQHDPIISGVYTTYHLSDFVTANCTSDRSNLPATLQWYINDEKASEQHIQHQHETISSHSHIQGFNLIERSLEIRFYIDQQKLPYSSGILKLQCIANVNKRTELTRESTVKAYILSNNDLTNEKLVNNRNSGRMIHHGGKILLLIAIVTLTRQALK